MSLTLLAVCFIIFCVSVILIIVSLVNPSIGLFWLRSARTRVKAIMIYGIVAFVCLVGFIGIVSTFRWAVQDQENEELDTNAFDYGKDSTATDTVNYRP